MGRSIECLGASFSDQIEHLTEIHLLASLIPPLLLALVAGEKLHFAPIGQAVLDLDHVANAALGTIHQARNLTEFWNLD